MKSKLAREKSADSMLSMSNSLGVAGCIAPFSYLLNIHSLGVIEQGVLRSAPFVIIVAALILRLLALHAFDKISELE